MQDAKLERVERTRAVTIVANLTTQFLSESMKRMHTKRFTERPKQRVCQGLEHYQWATDKPPGRNVVRSSDYVDNASQGFLNKVNTTRSQGKN